MVVLDTHVLVWWTLDPAQLSAPTQRLCDQIPESGAMVSAISLWEIGIKIKRGNLELGGGKADELLPDGGDSRHC